MLTVLNDTHIAVLRSAGTTPASQWELRQYVLARFKFLLPTHGDLLINGDLLDSMSVPVYDVLEVYKTLVSWLQANPSSRLYISAGNHDHSRTSSTLSSFQFLGKLLAMASDRYIHIEAPTVTHYGYVIPHLPNQGSFDEALLAIPAGTKVLFLHCNVCNFHAVNSDQSLNISQEQLEALTVDYVIVGHEHKMRRLGKVYIPGAQIATSVSDCTGVTQRWFATISDGQVTLNPLDCSGEYAEVDWRNIGNPTAKFIRCIGTATVMEAAAVVTAISRLRQNSEAFVITNAVQIEIEGGSSVFEDSLETVQQFSVMNALRELLSVEEMAILESLDVHSN